MNSQHGLSDPPHGVTEGLHPVMGPHLPATAGPDSSPRLRRAGPRLPCDLQTELLFLLPSRCLCLFNQAPGSEGADTERCLPIQGPETRRRGVHGERPSSAPLQPQSPTRVRATPPRAGRQDAEAGGWQPSPTATSSQSSKVSRQSYSQRRMLMVPCSRGVLSFQELQTQQS